MIIFILADSAHTDSKKLVRILEGISNIILNFLLLGDLAGLEGMLVVGGGRLLVLNLRVPWLGVVVVFVLNFVVAEVFIVVVAHDPVALVGVVAGVIQVFGHVAVLRVGAPFELVLLIVLQIVIGLCRLTVVF